MSFHEAALAIGAVQVPPLLLLLELLLELLLLLPPLLLALPILELDELPPLDELDVAVSEDVAPELDVPPPPPPAPRLVPLEDPIPEEGVLEILLVGPASPLFVSPPVPAPSEHPPANAQVVTTPGIITRSPTGMMVRTCARARFG